MPYWIRLLRYLARRPSHFKMKENVMNMKKFFQSALAISALFIGMAQTAQAEIIHQVGDTTGGPTLDLTPWEFPGNAIPYKQWAFTVGTAGEYTFQVTAEFDTVIMVFENSFDPADTVTNLVSGNDDDVSTTTSAVAAELTTGTTYYFVVTGFDNDQFGKYQALIGGPGLISAVPEPSTWLMLAFGLMAVTYAQRRKSLR
jgi:hypothetical protein